MQEEGDTVTTVIESQGDVEEVTQTTVTVEHKTTGDILDGDTGIVTSKYEGDADIDWGGAGAIYSHASCTDAASGFPATGTDGRTVACGHAKNNSLTTWRQYVDLNSFDIKDGGEVNYEFLFAFPNNMYTNANRTAYVQTKGYNDNALQWETGLVTIDKTTFTQNPNNYNNNTNWVNTVTGSYDFSNQLDKVYIEIGGYGEYYWDEFQYNVAYNHITTVVEIWLDLVVQQQDLDVIIDILDNYETVDFMDDNFIVDPIVDPIVNYTDDPPVIDYTDDPIVDYTIDSDMTELDMPELDIPMLELSPHQYEEIIVELDNLVEEIAEIAEIGPEETITEVYTDDPPVIEKITPEAVSTPTDDATEPNEVAEIVEPTEEVKTTDEPSNQDEQAEEQPAEETKDVADSEMETEEIQEEAKEETQSEEKEVAENEVEEKEIVEEKPKEEVKKTEAEEKSDKLKEKKQEKAKEIIENFASNYDAVAQITTLALVNALGPNIKTYSNQVVQPALDWYETEEIYTDVIIHDPLGNYISVKDSLTFNKMIDMQYE